MAKADPGLSEKVALDLTAMEFSLGGKVLVPIITGGKTVTLTAATRERLNKQLAERNLNQ